jgi:hypothetical protein
MSADIPRMLRCIVIPLTGYLVAIGLVGCGSGSSSGAAVIEVAGQPITKAAVDHWMSVGAATVSIAPGQPKADTPQPPSYSACIDYRERYVPGADGGPKLTRADLKSQCARQYQELRLHALYSLITNAWVLGEATELHVKLHAGEMASDLAKVEASEFGGVAGFRSYLAERRLTVPDFESEIKIALVAAHIQLKLESEPRLERLNVQQLGRSLQQFGREFERKWTSRTDCKASYVVPICRQYGPTKTPPTVVPPSVPLTEMNPGDTNALGVNPRRHREVHGA